MTTNLGPKLQQIVNEIIEREGGYVDHPSDRGGPTMYGITKAVAKLNGWHGEMSELPRDVAFEIYTKRYIVNPGFHRLIPISERVAEELIDSGVNFGQSVPIVWLQRWLNAFNRREKDYTDVVVDGVLGSKTIAALTRFLTKRGKEGEGVLHASLNCIQAVRYLELAEAGNKSQEDFLYGWVRSRVVAQL